MNFLLPGYLWGLLVLLPLAAIFFLKVRPRRQETNAFFLWQKVFEERQVSALFRRLRDLLSLLILLIAAAAIIFSLAQPRFEQGDERDILLVIDTSASMLAGEEGNRTIDRALTEARSFIQGLDGHRRLALATANHDLHFIQHLTSSPPDLQRALQRVSGTHLPLTPQLSSLLEPFVSRTSDYRVLFLTDGQDRPSLENLETVIVSGAHDGNGGIIAADLAWLPGRSGHATLFYQLASSFSEPRQAELELRHRDTGTISRIIPLTLESGQNPAETLELEDIEPGTWELTLHLPDGLTLDNEVLLQLPAPTRIPVAVTAADDYFYRRSVEAFSANGGLLSFAEEAQDARLIVTQGEAKSGQPALVFAPPGGNEVEILTAEALLPDHPAIAHLDLEALRFRGARELSVDDQSLIIASSESGTPLIVQREEQLIFNLDPAQGEFFLSPWFPVIVYNAALALSGQGPPPPAVLATHTTAPTIGLQPEGASTALLNLSETLLPDEVSLPFRRAEATQGRPLSVWLLIFALVLLTAEALLYHRRKLG